MAEDHWERVAVVVLGGVAATVGEVSMQCSCASISESSSRTSSFRPGLQGPRATLSYKAAGGQQDPDSAWPPARTSNLSLPTVLLISAP